jgi:hypothetical protein
MRTRQILLISAGVVISVILAFFLQDVIRRVVVIPLAYLSWVFKLLLSSIPQIFIWILLLGILILLIIASLVTWVPVRVSHQEISKRAMGPVENLAGWVQRRNEGNYYKWKIANRLGNLAREISNRQGNWRRTDPDKQANAPGQALQESVQRYLDAGTEESFVDYPLPPLPFMRRSDTPFDLEVEVVVDFLEDQLEAFSGQKHP